MYRDRIYPNYLSGTGYVMSIDVVPKLYEAALITPIFHLEDIYITGLCTNWWIMFLLLSYNDWQVCCRGWYTCVHVTMAVLPSKSVSLIHASSKQRSRRTDSHRRRSTISTCCWRRSTSPWSASCRRRWRRVRSIISWVFSRWQRVSQRKRRLSAFKPSFLCVILFVS